MIDLRMDSRPTVSKEDIKNALRQLGVQAGDRVMAHSSLKALGWIDGGSPLPFNKELTATEKWISAFSEVFRNTSG